MRGRMSGSIECGLIARIYYVNLPTKVVVCETLYKENKNYMSAYIVKLVYITQNQIPGTAAMLWDHVLNCLPPPTDIIMSTRVLVNLQK